MILRSRSALIRGTAVATLLLHAPLSAAADTRIRGEFEYNVDDRALSEWQIGPVFSLSESPDVELEIPFGQDDNVWLVQPELTYKLEVNDLNFKFSIGLEASLSNQPIQSFGEIEASVDF